MTTVEITTNGDRFSVEIWDDNFHRRTYALSSAQLIEYRALWARCGYIEDWK